MKAGRLYEACSGRLAQAVGGRIVRALQDCMKRHREQRYSSEGEFSYSRLFELIGLKDGMTLLDAGCGRGYFAAKAASRVSPNGYVIAADRHGQFLARIRQEIGPPPAANLAVLRADLHESIPLKDRSIDICLMVNVVHGMRARKEFGGAIDEVRRVLRRGGLWAIVDLRKDAAVELPSVSLRLAPDELRELVRASGLVLKKVVILNKHYQLMMLQ